MGEIFERKEEEGWSKKGWEGDEEVLVGWVKAMEGKVCFRGVVDERVEGGNYGGVKEVPR